MRKIIGIGLAISILFSSIPLSSNAQVPFKDLNSNNWAYPAVQKMIDKGVVNGYKDGSFKPNGVVTREEFAKMLVLTLGKTLQTPQNKTFQDVDTNSWSYPYIETAKQYLTGYRTNGNLYFKGKNLAVREDMAVAIVNAKGLSTQQADVTILDSYTDKDSITPSLRPYVAIAVKNNIMSGYGQGKFGPKNTLTRAQACQLMTKLIEAQDEEKVPVVTGIPTTTPIPSPIITVTPTPVVTVRPAAPNFTVDYTNRTISLGSNYSKYEYAYNYVGKSNNDTRWYLSTRWYTEPQIRIMDISAGAEARIAIRVKANGPTPPGREQLLYVQGPIPSVTVSPAPAAPNFSIDYMSGFIRLGSQYDKYEYSYTTAQNAGINMNWGDSANTRFYSAGPEISLKEVVGHGGRVIAIRQKAVSPTPASWSQILWINENYDPSVDLRPVAPNFTVDYVNGYINLGNDYGKYEYAYNYTGITNPNKDWYLSTKWYTNREVIIQQITTDNIVARIAIRTKATSTNPAGHEQLLNVQGPIPILRPSAPSFSIDYTKKVIDLGSDYQKYEYTYTALKDAYSNWYSSKSWFNAAQIILGTDNKAIAIRQKATATIPAGQVQTLNYVSQ